MTELRKPIFDAIRTARGKGFTQAEVVRIDDLLDDLGIPTLTEPASPPVPAPPAPPPSSPASPSAPRWYGLARSLIGTREIVGAQHSPTIMGWIAGLGAKVLGITVRDDETPWCATFMAHVMATSGIAPPPIAVRAASWANWGRELIAPRLGAVLVFTRQGGGHVGIYVGERSDAFRVLGGNQDNAVTETWIAKTRLAKGGIRWPAGELLPGGGRVLLSNDGAPLSRNEA
jgi:uncharacterized protein (TIGR02594 family)